MHIALRDQVRAEVARGADVPDYFSTRPTVELQAALRETPTRPLESLLNTGRVSIDVEQRRIFRDVFWKGSFARDTLLGWEERIRTSILGGAGVETGGVYAGGSFWKRFDRIDSGVATGHVVNYEIAALPGEPMVEEVGYPDDNRRYFGKGDRILLLRYSNHPYRIVYDTIKVIDDQNAIGVMHLGEFPRGIEFATFVMARHNYPFGLMSIEDFRLLFEDPRAVAPDADRLAGDWVGRLILLPRAGSILMSTANPVGVHLSLRAFEAGIEGRYRLTPGATGSEPGQGTAFTRIAPAGEWQEDLRKIGDDTLIGRWAMPDLPSSLRGALDEYLDVADDRTTGHFVLSRV